MSTPVRWLLLPALFSGACQCVDPGDVMFPACSSDGGCDPGTVCCGEFCVPEALCSVDAGSDGGDALCSACPMGKICVAGQCETPCGRMTTGCNGCCDRTNNRCLTGPSEDGSHCGFDGVSCGSCGGSNNACTPVSCTCDATNCPTGCCDGANVCHPQPDRVSCGWSGRFCSTCMPSRNCTPWETDAGAVLDYLCTN